MKYEKLILEIYKLSTEDIVTESPSTGNIPWDDDGEYPDGWDDFGL